jgi:glutaredoxin
MKYIYTRELCPACIKLKKKWNADGLLKGIDYQERDAGRLSIPADDRDSIDEEALVQLVMNNNQLPVIVERKDIKP